MSEARRHIRPCSQSRKEKSESSDTLRWMYVRTSARAGISQSSTRICRSRARALKRRSQRKTEVFTIRLADRPGLSSREKLSCAAGFIERGGSIMPSPQCRLLASCVHFRAFMGARGSSLPAFMEASGASVCVSIRLPSQPQHETSFTKDPISYDLHLL